MPKKCSCGKYSIYNVPGEKKPICCKDCKTNGMVDVVSRRCPCGKRPIYNVSGEKKPICCKDCKTDEMIDVVNKRCSCGKQPIYNVPGEKKPICCKDCKTDEMVNVVNKKCPCGKQPSFNIPGEKIGVCCSKCKTDEMVDVVSKKCPCGKRPKFNIPEETKGVCCKDCKTGEMIDVVHKRCPCGSLSTVFNMTGEVKGICCMKCKTDDMIDVVSKICPGYNGECPVRTRIGSGHEYCMACDPNDARRKMFKRYEEAFFDYVKDNLDVHKREFRVMFDPNETSKKFARLDGVVFGDGVIVCIEVDENGHQDYECDEHRMHLVTAELLQKYPGHSVSWVRVNPTIDAKSQWSKTSKKKREKRFEDVVMNVKNILKKRDTRIAYVGF